MLKQGLEDEIAVAKKQLGEDTLTRSTTEEELHAAEGALTEAQATLAADTKYLAELRQSCATKAAQWEQRQKGASEETAAIEKAKSILTEGVKAFLQTSTRVRSLEQTDESNSARVQATAVLSKLAKKFHSFALTQLATRSRSDPFGKIRGLIEDMISSLTKAAAEEADQKSFCDEENKKSTAQKGVLTGKFDKTSARIEKAEAGMAMLKEGIATLEKEVAEIDAGQAEATGIRQDEHAEYLKASQDQSDSAKAVAKAIEVLDNYYSSASFVQVSQPEFGGAKSDIGSTITSILEVAESDFTQMLAESDADETSAASAYDKLSKENAVVKATKQADAKGKTNEVAALEVALGNYKENKASTSNELDAVLDYLDKLKPQCETKVMSYAEKKARREQEIEGLKEALTILSGESLLQVRSSTHRRFLQKSFENKQMSAWPHTYQNCVAGTCRGADQIKSHMPCVENLYHNIGEEYKKFGANLKVTLYMRNRCEQYYDKVHVLECTSADEWVAFSPKFPVQSYKVESCV